MAWPQNKNVVKARGCLVYSVYGMELWRLRARVLVEFTISFAAMITKEQWSEDVTIFILQTRRRHIKRCRTHSQSNSPSINVITLFSLDQIVRNTYYIYTKREQTAGIEVNAQHDILSRQRVVVSRNVINHKIEFFVHSSYTNDKTRFA
jgi:hypothetical protein